MSNTTFDVEEFKTLAEIPNVDISANFQTAMKAGNKYLSILKDTMALRRGAGSLSINEYFYYRLWESSYTLEQKKCFVGKTAQPNMHLACNDVRWHAPAGDKLLFQTLMKGAELPVPQLLAVTGRNRNFPGIPTLETMESIADFLRKPDHYPLFIKPIDGKFSLLVTSADAFDRETDELILVDGRRKVPELAEELSTHGVGYLIQKRLSSNPLLSEKFGKCLWSLRLLVLLTPAGPYIHRAVAKIATGKNPADNFWRPGNMLGAVGIEGGTITRVVRGSALEMTVNDPHPDTGREIVGTKIPDWEKIKELTHRAATFFPGIRTQSWDVALTDKGPVFLEVNFGGDLNLAQISYGEGVLDETYAEHLTRCGHKFRK